MTKPVNAVPFAVSPATGAPALPLTLGQVLDRIYLLTRANLRLFLRITTIPAILFIILWAPILPTWQAIVVPLQSGQHPALTRGVGWLLAADAVSFLLILLFFPLYEAAACYTAVQTNAGVAVTGSQAWRFTSKRAGRYVWLALLRGLVASAPMAAACIVLEGAIWVAQSRIARGQSPNVAFVIAGIAMLLYFAGAVYAALVSVRMVLVYPASVAENLTAWKAVVRSIRLAKGASLRIFVASFVTYALTYAIFLVVALILATFTIVGVWVIVALHAPVASWAYVWMGIMGALLAFALFFWIAFFWAAFETGAAVLYHDQLLRKEGLAPAPVGSADITQV
jgi:hypothetical protein